MVIISRMFSLRLRESCDFFKEEGGPYHLLFIDFVGVSFEFEDGRHVLDANCG